LLLPAKDEYRNRRRYNFKQGEQMPRPKGSGNKNRSELVQLALAGIDAQIQQFQNQIDLLTDKRRQISRSDTGSTGATGAVVSSGRKAAKKSAKAAGKEAGKAAGKKKRVVSAATRKKLKEAAKARWARQRGEGGGE
jgi:hypothetical protein